MAIRKADLDAIRRRFELMGQDIPKAEYQAIGNSMVEEMKAQIAKGISPIRGGGRFPAYKGAKDKKSYPYSVRKKYPGKRERPVNLYLSGDFLKSLKATAVAAYNKVEIFIGLTDPLSKKKEQGHREGANGQALRPIIPESGEDFSLSIRTKGLEGLSLALHRSVTRNKGN
jgi:hypothetical protein